MKKSNKKVTRSKVSKKERMMLPTNESITDSTLNRINQLEKIHEERKKTHSIHDLIAYWTFIFVVLISNFFLSIVIVFLIIYLQDPLIYLIIGLLGLSFGAMYENMINGMSHIFIEHHIYAKVFILLTAGINIFYIVTASAIVMDAFSVPNIYYKPIHVSFVYFISYLIPYILAKIRKVFLS